MPAEVNVPDLSDDFWVQKLLIDSGCLVDVRSTQGATSLLNAVQSKGLSQARFLLTDGADAGAKDGRGFRSLHRAAEMGLPEFVELSVANGADPKPRQKALLLLLWLKAEGMRR